MPQRQHPSPRGQLRVGPNYYGVIPNRAAGAGSAGNDLKTYREPRWMATGNYQTFWRGNTLPSASVFQVAPVYRVLRREQFPRTRTGGGFDAVLSVENTVNLLRNMQAAWRTAQQQQSIAAQVPQFSMGR